jgi:hypothetical protein
MSLSSPVREHFKGLMFGYYKQQAPSLSQPSVGTIADAARMSAYATVISTFYGAHRKLSDIAQECLRHTPDKRYGAVSNRSSNTKIFPAASGFPPKRSSL